MTNGNGDFPYWESDRTQPGGSTESDIKPRQLEALQSYLSQRQQIPYNFASQLPVQQPPAQQPPAQQPPTISITTGSARIDITITPL